MMFLIFVLTLPLLSRAQQRYEVTVKYSCLEFYGTPGQCVRWQQHGELKFDWGCFPGEAWVIGEHGPLKMSELHAGDKILGLDRHSGSEAFSPVRGWLHRNPLGTALMVDVYLTDGSKLRVSSGHMLAVHCGSQVGGNRSASSGPGGCRVGALFGYMRASALVCGDVLVSANKTAYPAGAIVDRLENVKAEGLYSPFTMHHTFYVLTAQPNSTSGISEAPGVPHGQALLAHSFTDLSRPELYESAWSVLVFLSEHLLPLAMHSVNEATSDYVHPVIQLLSGIRSLGRARVSAEPVLVEGNVDIVPGSPHVTTTGRRLGGAHGSGEDSRLLIFSALQTAILPPFMAKSAPVWPDPPMKDFILDYVQTEFDDDDDDSSSGYAWLWFWILLSICLLTTIGLAIALVVALTSRHHHPNHDDARRQSGGLVAGSDRPYEDYDPYSHEYPPPGMYGPPPQAGYGPPWQGDAVYPNY